MRTFKNCSAALDGSGKPGHDKLLLIADSEHGTLYFHHGRPPSRPSKAANTGAGGLTLRQAQGEEFYKILMLSLLISSLSRDEA